MSHKNKFSRRRFIAAAAASVATPMIVPRHVLGGEGNTAPSEKINLGLVGMGFMMRRHCGQFLDIADARVAAVCDVYKTRLDDAKNMVDKKYGNKDCKAYGAHTEIMANDDIDAVFCAMPAHWHAIVSLDAIKAGKDMYCEKPLTNNLAEAKIVMDAANRSDVIFQVGSQQRADPNFRYACELVRNGRVGEIKKVEVSVGGPPAPHCNLPGEKMEPGLDWDRWLGPAPMREYSSVLCPRGVHNHFPSWRVYREYSGAGLTGWGTHHFDIAQWALGMDHSGPVEVIPAEKPERGRGVKFLYDNGIEMTHSGPKGITFHGTEGTLYVARGKLQSTPESIIKEKIGDDEIHLYKAPLCAPGDYQSPWISHKRDWLDCIKSRKQPSSPAEFGARSVGVSLLAVMAYLHAEELEGKTMKWDPKKWEFVGDNAETYNQWQDYPYPRRKGYELPVV